MKLSREVTIIIVIIVLVLGASALIWWLAEDKPRVSVVTTGEAGLGRFESEAALVQAFKDQEAERDRLSKSFADTTTGVAETETAAPAEGLGSASDQGGGGEFSETNIQVAGVDEADIVKTDGKYVYALAQEGLQIVNAYPAEQAELLSTTEYDNFYPSELFIDGDRLLVFGTETYEFTSEVTRPSGGYDAYPYYLDTASVRLYDVSDRGNPELLRQIEFEGTYVTSRKIGDYVYFVINTYPSFEEYTCADILPGYREGERQELGYDEGFEPMVACEDVAYIEPLQAENFLTVASISMADSDEEVAKEVVVGSGQNVYASPENLYVAQSSWPDYLYWYEDYEPEEETSVVTRFALDNGMIEYKAAGEVPGHILNQFSMDEYDDHFRIATTVGEVWNTETLSQNNLYVLDMDMKVVGALENLAPGESIYSARFMGERGYLVTFKKIDPLFVVDLSVHSNPNVLGKLKIPGYSDYLHPYDDNHIIGIGKETVEAEETLKEERELDFAWHQGVKLAIFDVTDVANPIEMYKEVIGDRGTDTPVLYDHKAFLFDKDKDLMVLPITLAEIEGEPSADNTYGDYVYQGAYVYNVTLENGFDLRGRVTHYDDPSVFEKSGYYFSGDEDITRSLYIDSVLYTLSQARLQANNLENLDRIKEVDFPVQPDSFEVEPL